MVPRESIKFVPIFWIVGYEYVYVPYLRGPPAPRCRDRTRTADARVTLRPPLPHHKEAAHRGLLGPGRQMRLLTGPAVFTKRYASFTPGLWLHEWLTRACMSCLAFFGPTPSQAPQAPWEHGPQHSLVQHLPRGGLSRQFGPLALELRYTACRQFASHTAGCSAERVNKYTLGPCCSSLHRRL